MKIVDGLVVFSSVLHRWLMKMRLQSQFTELLQVVSWDVLDKCHLCLLT